MKRLIFLSIVLLALFSACSKEYQTVTTDEVSISTSSLPLAIQQYVADNYPDETIVSAVQLKSGSASYLVTLNTTESLAFSSEGDFMGDGALFSTADSIGGGGHRGGHGGGHHGDGPGGPGRHDSLNMPHDSIHGQHDSIGGGHPGGGPGHNNGNGRFDSIPSVITDYVAANFAGYVAKHAEIKANCQFDSVYEVMIVKDTLQPLKVFFSLTGTYLMQAERALFADAPQAVKDYITANYADYKVKLKMEVYTLADGTKEYRAFLNKKNTKVTVLLKADGTLVCSK